MSNSITAGQEVTYQGAPYVVRSIDGNVLALEYHTGGFFRFVHLTSVTACSPSAIQTAATSLDAPAAGQGEGTLLRCEFAETRRKFFRFALLGTCVSWLISVYLVIGLTS